MPELQPADPRVLADLVREAFPGARWFRYFDLGHFLLHDGETRPARLFSSFLNGYCQVSPLPDGHIETIRASAILLGLRQLSLWLSPERACPLSRPLVQLRIAELSNLLTDEPA